MKRLPTLSPFWLRAAPWILGGCALALAVLSTFHYRSFVGARADLLTRAEEAASAVSWSGPRPAPSRSLLREQDPVYGRLRLARALVVEELTSPSPEAAAAQRLEQARRLAATALTEVPSSWEAPMVLGAATYLEWSRRRDDRLFLQAAAWEEPLLRSLALAPGRDDANRFLATAYLEIWPALAPAKRDAARAVVQRALAQPATFERLLEPWLERAGSRAVAFEALPARAAAWRRVESYYAERGEWSPYLEARRRRGQVEHEEVRQAVAAAELRLTGGDPAAARQAYLAAAGQAPPEPAADALVDGIFRRCPPGREDSTLRAGLRRQLDRALDLYLHRSRPFEPATVRRLAASAGTLEPPEAALAALAGEDLVRAEGFERRVAEAAQTLEWAPYQLARARELIRRGELAQAAVALDRVHSAWTLRPIYWQVQRRLVEAGHEEQPGRAAERLPPSVPARATIRERLAAFSGPELPAGAWMARPPVHRLEWLPDEAAGTVEIAIEDAPAGGTVVEIRLDGYFYGLEAVSAGGRLRIEAPLAAGEVHLLELLTLPEVPFTPGRVRFTAG